MPETTVSLGSVSVVEAAFLCSHSASFPAGAEFSQRLSATLKYCRFGKSLGGD